MSESETMEKMSEEKSLEKTSGTKSMKKVSEIDTFLTNISLYHDEEVCKACGMCEMVCPKDAIELGPSGAIGKKATNLPSLEVDEEKCVLCGVCDAICPFSAFHLEVDGEHKVLAVDYEAFPRLIKTVDRDPEKCEMAEKCVEACPVNAITVEDGEWKIDMNICVTCPWCEDACPHDAISVDKMMEGEIEIDTSECPLGCAVCLDVCPVNAIYEPESEEPWERTDRIAVDERYCIYCGACVEACPVEGAIKLDRSEIKAQDIKSLIWDESKEKLARKIESRSIEEEE